MQFAKDEAQNLKGVSLVLDSCRCSGLHWHVFLLSVRIRIAVPPTFSTVLPQFLAIKFAVAHNPCVTCHCSWLSCSFCDAVKCRTK